jgi:hypothetical protein
VKPEQVSSLINCLTKNEDERQDLWVHYLSGNTADTFASKLQSIQETNQEDQKVKEVLWTILEISKSEHSIAFSKFSDFDRNIIFLLMLDWSPEQISSYKGISEVRIRQAITSLRYNSTLKEQYGTQKIINR